MTPAYNANNLSFTGGDHMAEDKSVQSTETKEESSEESSSASCCCYYVDPCGCYYVDPCGCRVDPCCC